MFEIANRRQLWLGTIILVCMAMVLASMAVFLVFPVELAQDVFLRAMVIVFLVASPLVRFVLGSMYANHLLSEELRQLVERDRLTDVATRDFFFAQMEGTTDNYGVSLMIDIDHFKSINDTHGHLVGDEVLKNVAGALRQELRERDIVCRFGGEEFLVFLFQSNEVSGWQVAERMRKAVEDLAQSDEMGDVEVTISVGGSMKDQVEQIEDAIKRADECLYRAKRSGRNCIVVDWDMPLASGQPRVALASS